MMSMNSKQFMLRLSLFILLAGLIAFPQPAKAQLGSAYDLINEVNALRAANGLPPFSINAALMAAAQGHADWISATGLGGHEGADGSYAVDRARAAGYGGGAAVFVNENWARGYNLSVYNCVYVMWDDPDHNGNMLATWHNEIGAGVSIDSENRVTYIVNVGHVSGSTPIEQPTLAPGETEIPYLPNLQTSTPNPDGGIMHVVKAGETLWVIATAYGLSLDELLALNGLTADSPIYPDDVLIIRLGTTPEASSTTEEETQPTATIRPSQTPRSTLTPVLTPTATATQVKVPGLIERVFSGDARMLGIGLIAVCVLGLALLIFTSSRIR